MKRLYIILALFLTSCSGVSAEAMGLNIPLATQQMITIEQAATRTASAIDSGPTPTETATPMPTVDMESVNATLAASDARVKQAVADKGAALGTAQSAFATAQEANAIVMIATVTLGAQQLENNKINLEAQKVKATDDTDIRTQQAFIVTATAYAPTQIIKLAQAKSEAETMTYRMIIESSLWPLLILCGTGLLLYILRKWATPWPQPVEPVTPNLCEQEETRPSAPVRILERQAESASYNRDTDPPGDPEKFRALIAHTRKGDYLGMDVVVAAGVYGSYPEYAPVIKWLEDHRYIATTSKGGKVFSIAGRQFCDEWEKSHPCPSPEDAQKEHENRYNNNSYTEGEPEKYQFATSAPDGFMPIPPKRRRGVV